MMTKELCVQTVPLFKQLSEAQQEQIEQLVRHEKVKKGELVLTPADPGQLIILESGQLKIVQFTEAGTEKLYGIMEKGDHTGENWLFGATNQSLFLSASQDSHVCKLSKKDFHQLLVNLPELSYQLLRFTVEHNNQLLKQNAYLALGRVEERLLAYFTELALQQRTQQITLPFNLKDLAAYLGTTPETISRKLTKLVKDKRLKKLNNLQYELL